MTGLAGHGAHYTQIVWLVASGLGVGVLIGLGLIYRRARGRHELEEAEQILAAEDAADAAEIARPDRPPAA